MSTVGSSGSFATTRWRKTSPPKRFGGYTARTDVSMRPEVFRRWIRRFATNLALDQVKAARPEESLSADYAATGADPIVRRQQSAAIRVAFARLPARFRLVAHLALVEQCPYAEIADTVGLSESGVKSRVFRAVRLLRSELKEMGMEP